MNYILGKINTLLVKRLKNYFIYFKLQVYQYQMISVCNLEERTIRPHYSIIDPTRVDPI